MKQEAKQYKAETFEHADKIARENLGYAKIFEDAYGICLYNPTPLPKDWGYSCGAAHAVLAIDSRGRTSGLVTICASLTLSEAVNKERERASSVLASLLPVYKTPKKKKK